MIHKDMNSRTILTVCFAAWIVAGFSLFGYAETQEQKLIGSVETAGGVTVTRTQVFSAIRLRPCQIFSDKTAAEDAARIAKLDGVESSYYTAETVDGKIKLTYVVVEKQLVRELVFIGNKKLSISKLTNSLKKLQTQGVIRIVSE